ncbi:hypothetical protein ACH4D4_19050 [Streptomyces pristinaespiralis]|uniref:hypothetical protein n=1 Tax=Streptomyces pristinaespiralis TaxID=38300 RepID=UPI0037AA86E3
MTTHPYTGPPADAAEETTGGTEVRPSARRSVAALWRRPVEAVRRPPGPGPAPWVRVWRVLGPGVWARATGRGPGGRRATAAFLRRRMLVLPALALVALALCAAAYSDVHGRSDRLRHRSVPALEGLAQARTSLVLAGKQAELRLLEARQAGRVELGETYRSRLTEASQSLNRVAQTGALSRGQEQELRVVSGLVVAYGDKIAWADRNRSSKLLRTAGVEYAAGLLGSPDTDPAEGQDPTTVLDRIEEMESLLRQESGDLAAWSPLTLTAAGAAVLTTALFGFLTVGTAVFLRDRLRLVSLQLAACALPVLVTPLLLAFGGAQEHGAQQDVHAAVAGLADVEADEGAPRAIERAADAAHTRMSVADPDGWSLTAGITVPAAGLGAVACGVTLYLYGRPYPAARTRRTYTDA